MARRDVRLGSLLRSHLDGIPLDLAARLLPWRSRFSPGLGPHIHLHARGQRRHAGGGDAAARDAGRARVGRLGGEALIDSLRRTVAGLDWTPAGTEWADYEPAPRRTTRRAPPRRRRTTSSGRCSSTRAVTWSGTSARTSAGTARSRRSSDGGSSRGTRTRPPSSGTTGRSGPLPPRARSSRSSPTSPIPTPSVGWALRERRSLLDRADADVALALALIHHLAIGRNVPLPRIADLFASLAPGLIVEWVGRDDPMVARLLATREDVFRDYDDAGFRAAFGRRFRVAEERPLPGTARVLFRMERLA